MERARILVNKDCVEKQQLESLYLEEQKNSI